MRTHRNGSVVLWTASLAIALLGAGHAIGYEIGETILIDDFSDGDTDGWALVDLSEGQPWGPGLFDASSGALRVAHTGPELVPPDAHFPDTALLALWEESSNPVFSDGILRAMIRTDEPENSTSIIMRGDLSTFSAYLLFGDTRTVTGPGGISNVLRLSKLVAGVETVLWNSPFPYLPGEDWNVELGAVGDRVSVKAWKVAGLEPDSPQFVVTDSDLTSGMVMLVSDVSNAQVLPARADATFDDIYFTFIPEPSTLALLTLGSLGLLAFGWRRRKRDL